MVSRKVLGLGTLAFLSLLVAASFFALGGDASALSDEAELVMFDPARGEWHMLHDMVPEGGAKDSFFYGTPGDTPLLGDWDCDGYDTVAMFRPTNGFIYLRNTNTFGVADEEFFFGMGGDIPLAGDWDGDGCDTFSIYRPTEAKVYVSNRLGTHPAEFSYYYGVPGDKPFSGDFDGDGVATVGLYRDTTGFVYFRDSLSTGVADFDFYYGAPDDRIVAGDWTGDGTETVAIFRPTEEMFYLSFENKQGFADEEVSFGEQAWLPLAGRLRTTAGAAAYSVAELNHAVPEAAPYTGDPPHKLIVVGDSGQRHAFDAQLPSQWRAGDVSSLELVVSIEDWGLTLFEHCPYPPIGDIYRWGYEVWVEVTEANTGDWLFLDDVRGNSPQLCPLSYRFDPAHPREDWYGDPVSVTDLEDEIDQWVLADLAPTSTTSTTSTSTSTTTSTTTIPTTTTTIPVPEEIDLPTAVGAGLVEIRFSATGGASGDIVELEIKRSDPEDLEITVPPGLELINPTSSQQNLVISRLRGEMAGPGSYWPSRTIELLDDLWHDYLIEAFCADADEANPSSGTGMSLGGEISANLTSIIVAADSLNESTLVSQASVWAETNDVSRTKLASIGYGLSDSEVGRARTVVETAGLNPDSYSLFD